MSAYLREQRRELYSRSGELQGMERWEWDNSLLQELEYPAQPLAGIDLCSKPLQVLSSCLLWGFSLLSQRFLEVKALKNTHETMGEIQTTSPRALRLDIGATLDIYLQFISLLWYLPCIALGAELIQLKLEAGGTKVTSSLCFVHPRSCRVCKWWIWGLGLLLLVYDAHGKCCCVPREVFPASFHLFFLNNPRVGFGSTIEGIF